MPHHIVVLGASGTRTIELTESLREALATHKPSLRVTIDAQPSSDHDFALLMGLEHSGAPAQERTAQERQDKQLRDQLHSLGLPYRVLYGSGPERLNNALLALGLPVSDAQIRLAREQAQFDLNRGRTPWSCEKCSDPDCEHKLFSRLLR